MAIDPSEIITWDIWTVAPELDARPVFFASVVASEHALSDCFCSDAEWSDPSPFDGTGEVMCLRGHCGIRFGERRELVRR
ncbi:MAG: hypothetical protein FWD57_07875 [Polyangiaceae bacterium]|nr:hypothetical protein [Polyangiaceae bacterium]